MSTPLRLLTPVEVGQQLRKSPWWVTKQCRSGALRASLFGGTWHVTEDAIAAYVAAHANVPDEPAPVRRRRKRAA